MTAHLSDYAPSMDLTEDVLKAMQALAFKVGGTLAMTREGRVVVYGDNLDNRAVAIAGVLTSNDFPYGFVVPGTDSVLVFEF